MSNFRFEWREIPLMSKCIFRSDKLSIRINLDIIFVINFFNEFDVNLAKANFILSIFQRFFSRRTAHRKHHRLKMYQEIWKMNLLM